MKKPFASFKGTFKQAFKGSKARSHASPLTTDDVSISRLSKKRHINVACRSHMRMKINHSLIKDIHLMTLDV